MTVDVDAHWVLAVFLLSIRIGTLLMMTPILSAQVGPMQIRVVLIIAFSTLLVAALGLSFAQPLTLGTLVTAAVSEFVTGAVLAFGVFAAFAAFSLAGKLLDLQIGFGIANVFDPITRAQGPVLTTALNLLAIAVFYGMDAHHALFRGVAFSLSQVPLGAGHLGSIETAIRQFGLIFSLGLSIIVPVFICLLLIELGSAAISRVLPQMNILVVMMPLKVLAGLSLLALLAPTMGDAMRRIYGSIFVYWQEVLHG